jgi:murein DD-endopeptidase MepM/ murein hydrolase activator NlpD
MRVLRSAAFAASALGIVLAIPAIAHPHALDAPVSATGAAAPAGAAPTHHHSPWTWPLTTPPGRHHPTIVRPFEPPAKRWQSGHRGVDLLANPGDPVLAAGAGTVSFAGSLFGRPVVAVDHTAPGRDTLRTTYEPVDPTVKVGDKVQRGQQIGTLAKDATDPAVGHCAPRACLHWGLVRGFGHDAHYLDPRGLFARRSVRLLPIWEVR